MILAEDCLNAVAIYLTGFENVIALLDTNITFQLIKSIAQYANEVIITYPVNQTILNYFSEANLPTKTLNLGEMQSPENYIITYGAEKFRNLIANAKDANLIQLENCQNGLDLESKQDKNMILQNSIQVLAGIKNPLERDIYLVQTAKKLNINPDNLRIQVNQNIQKKFKSQSKNASTRSLTQEELRSSKKSIG
ncbi:MAG: hypothetical protein K2O52_07275 [Oscillospiraceae bacterium]|nr:hypothetical protein [Oscillospiraceae bacterium]